MVEKAVATDDTHVEITMTKPYNALLYTLHRGHRARACHGEAAAPIR